ncbi:MAG TPA: alpha/beta hydrolase [Caldimonas sp.]|jgi:arylformamidase|nr:alpha/beta hydrolase [Caldimonas sp.]HEX2540989.1 alpha/beta hydrolase [Caldimonas sp.]
MTTLYRDFTSPAQIDAQYNAGAAVPDAAERLRAYAEKSRLARERLRCILDVPFGPTLDETLDIFPADDAGAPVFVFIHGGYWRALSSKDFSFVATGLQPLGITTVLVDYSLCPKVTIDEITRQARAAVAWTLRRIGEHGGDPRRVAVGGHSAGGHLTAMCLQARWAEDYGLPNDPLAAAVLVSGIYDIEPLRHSYLQPQIQLDDGIVRRNSPLFAVRACATPILITWGADESAEFARQSQSLHAAWQAAGNRSELLAQAGANHFSAIDGFADPGSPLCRWLGRALLRSR